MFGSAKKVTWEWKHRPLRPLYPLPSWPIARKLPAPADSRNSFGCCAPVSVSPFATQLNFEYSAPLRFFFSGGEIRMRALCVFLAVVVVTCFSAGQEPRPLNLMPWPSEVKTAAGQMPIDPSFGVTIHGSDPRLKKTAETFLEDLRRHTGFLPLDFSISDNPAQGHPGLAITSNSASKEVQEVGEDESYQLNVTPAGAELIAPTTLGVMRGLQTFLQLVQVTPQGYPGQTAFHLAWPDDRFRPPFHASRSTQAQSRRNGCGEAQRFSLAPLRKSGLPYREQALS